MKNIFLIAISTITLMLSSCNNSIQMPSEYVGCWVESDRVNNIITMCHCKDYTPGPARHFYRFTLNEDGKGSYFYLSPNDAHRDIPIRWKAGNSVLSIKGELLNRKFSIEELTKTTLKLTAIFE